MGAMKAIATELETRWTTEGKSAGYQHWSRMMPDNRKAVIITDPRDRAWLHVGGKLIADCEHVSDALVMARILAKVMLSELAKEWAA